MERGGTLPEKAGNTVGPSGESYEVGQDLSLYPFIEEKTKSERLKPHTWDTVDRGRTSTGGLLRALQLLHHLPVPQREEGESRSPGRMLTAH